MSIKFFRLADAAVLVPQQTEVDSLARELCVDTVKIRFCAKTLRICLFRMKHIRKDIVRNTILKRPGNTKFL